MTRGITIIVTVKRDVDVDVNIDDNVVIVVDDAAVDETG